MQGEKPNTILAEYSEETFEFSDPRELPDGRILTNVCNLSHDHPSEHVYPLFFDVEQDGAVVGARVLEGGCPSDEFHDGACKHREAAAQCAELLGHVLSLALGGSDATEEEDAHAGAEQPDGGQTVVTDGGQIEYAREDGCEVCGGSGRTEYGERCFACVIPGGAV